MSYTAVPKLTKGETRLAKKRQSTQAKERDEFNFDFIINTKTSLI